MNANDWKYNEWPEVDIDGNIVSAGRKQLTEGTHRRHVSKAARLTEGRCRKPVKEDMTSEADQWYVVYKNGKVRPIEDIRNFDFYAKHAERDDVERIIPKNGSYPSWNEKDGRVDESTECQECDQKPMTEAKEDKAEEAEFDVATKIAEAIDAIKAEAEEAKEELKAEDLAAAVVNYFAEAPEVVEAIRAKAEEIAAEAEEPAEEEAHAEMPEDDAEEPAEDAPVEESVNRNKEFKKFDKWHCSENDSKNLSINEATEKDPFGDDVDVNAELGYPEDAEEDEDEDDLRTGDYYKAPVIKNLPATWDLNNLPHSFTNEERYLWDHVDFLQEDGELEVFAPYEISGAELANRIINYIPVFRITDSQGRRTLNKHSGALFNADGSVRRIRVLTDPKDSRIATIKVVG